MSDVVIVGAKRTAIGSFLGQFTGVPTPTLGTAAITGALEHAGLAADQVEEVIMGCVLPAGLGQAPARQAALGAGLPTSAGCTTINKVCGSGMKAIMLGHDLIKAGSARVVVAGGMESMTNAPHLLNGSRTGVRYGSAEFLDHMAHDGLTNPYDGKAMGVFGDMACEKYAFDRAALDAFSEESVKRAQKAQADGSFKDEIVPVTVKTRKGEVVVDTDEEPGKIDTAKIPNLRPAFGKEGVLTAASSSKIFDGRAARLAAVADDFLEVRPQRLDIDLGELGRGVARLRCQRIVGQQRRQQVAGTHRPVLELQRAEHPCFADQLDDVGRQRRRTAVAGLEPVERLGQVGGQAPGIDLEMPQDRGDVVVGRFDQLRQPVLDLDIIMGARERQAHRAFKCGTAVLIEPANQRLQIDIKHDFPLVDFTTPVFAMHKFQPKRESARYGSRDHV